MSGPESILPKSCSSLSIIIIAEPKVPFTRYRQDFTSRRWDLSLAPILSILLRQSFTHPYMQDKRNLLPLQHNYFAR